MRSTLLHIISRAVSVPVAFLPPRAARACLDLLLGPPDPDDGIPPPCRCPNCERRPA